MNNNDKILERCKESSCKIRSLRRKLTIVSIYSILITMVCVALLILRLPIESNVINAEVVEPMKYEEYIATAYCDCRKCCGKTDGITASGVKAVEGVTVAMDKSVPFGTKVYIKGVGERIVQDRGGAIKGNKIDIFFDNHSDALKFGRRTVNLAVIEGE